MIDLIERSEEVHTTKEHREAFSLCSAACFASVYEEEREEGEGEGVRTSLDEESSLAFYNPFSFVAPLVSYQICLRRRKWE
jgi:hypothetical protein